jgi:hypothetical protein
MTLTLEDYEQIKDDAFEGTFYYGDNMVIARISTEWIIDYEENDFEINAVVLSARQYDHNDEPIRLTITNEEIEDFVENEMHEWFDEYLKKIA